MLWLLYTEGNTTQLMTLQEEYCDEYEALTKEERAELIAEFDASKDQNSKACHPTACSRIQDVANVARNMESLVGSSS
jgi:hypothetical protein